MPRRWASRRCESRRGSTFPLILRVGRRSARASAGWRRASTPPGRDVSPQLPRVMRLRGGVLSNISALVGLRWLPTAASQFGLASLGLWLLAMVVFFLPSAVAVRELAEIDPAAGGIYRWVRRAFGPLHGFVAGGGYWGEKPFFFPPRLVGAGGGPALAPRPRYAHPRRHNTLLRLPSPA